MTTDGTIILWEPKHDKSWSEITALADVDVSLLKYVA